MESHPMLTTASEPLVLTAHGPQIPALRFGTSPTTGSMSPDEIVAALTAGYRHIDIARFVQAIKVGPEPLVALQAECHPYLDQSKLLAAVRQPGLAFVVYCPLGRGRLFSDPVLAEIAQSRGKSIAQIALRWLMQ